MFYMDEVFGYLPPVANPPSKLPLLTLLKQARAFGVGIVLATQNPVDLDYKALSNTGTWFLGKLQTERDKARVLEGIDSLASSVDRRTLDDTLSALPRRVFLMHNVHELEPVLFETRWTLSYLRGPMSREELKRATAEGLRPQAAGLRAGQGHSDEASDEPDATAERANAKSGHSRRRRPQRRCQSQFCRPGSPSCTSRSQDSRQRPGHQWSMEPRGFSTRTRNAASTKASTCRPSLRSLRAQSRLTGITRKPPRFDRRTLPPAAPAGGPASHAAPPAPALSPKSYAGWQKDFEQWIARARPLQLVFAPTLKLTSKPGESERDFQIRLNQSAREARDAEVEKLRARYAPKLQRITAKVRSSQDSVAREQQQAQQQKLQSAVSIGSTLLGALMGRKAISMSTLGRATTAARGVSRSMKESQDIAGAEERVRGAAGRARRTRSRARARDRSDRGHRISGGADRNAEHQAETRRHRRQTVRTGVEDTLTGRGFEGSRMAVGIRSSGSRSTFSGSPAMATPSA